MDEDEFHDHVTQSKALNDPAATAEATLETLGETISGGEAEEVAKWLPDRYADAVTSAAEGDAESISYERFLERVRERERERGGEGSGEVQARAAAVADGLAAIIPHDELISLRTQLPDELGSLFTEGQGIR